MPKLFSNVLSLFRISSESLNKIAPHELFRDKYFEGALARTELRLYDAYRILQPLCRRIPPFTPLHGLVEAELGLTYLADNDLEKAKVHLYGACRTLQVHKRRRVWIALGWAILTYLEGDDQRAYGLLKQLEEKSDSYLSVALVGVYLVLEGHGDHPRLHQLLVAELDRPYVKYLRELQEETWF